jgi:hypothetical protein
MYKFPFPPYVIPAGNQNRAFAPIPSLDPEDPARPAVVVTAAVEIMSLRIV